MLGRGDSSSSQDREIPKETEKQMTDHIRRLSNQYQRLKDGPSPTNYPYHIDKMKVDKYLNIVQESFIKSDTYQRYQERLQCVEGNSNQEILEKQSKINKDLEDDPLYKLYKNLREDLEKRSK